MTMSSLGDRASHDEAGDGPEDGVARSPRSSVMLAAVVEHFGGRAATRHRVRDLAAGGIRIDQADGLKAGASVVISVGALEAVGAMVVWVAAGSAGLAFAERIDPERARKRTAMTPRPPAQATATVHHVAAPPPASAIRPVGTAAGAGWIVDRTSPYRR